MPRSLCPLSPLTSPPAVPPPHRPPGRVGQARRAVTSGPLHGTALSLRCFSPRCPHSPLTHPLLVFAEVPPCLFKAPLNLPF